MAIKELVFDEKKYTMAQLMEALDADWEGFDEMRADFLAAPKYGNNIPEVDELVNEVYQLHNEACRSYPSAYGETVKPNAISISAHQPGGALTGATPDGRKGGEILADASISPSHGKDLRGPLAVFQSAMRIQQDQYQGTLFNMKFHPSVLKTSADLNKLAGLIRTYLTPRGQAHPVQRGGPGRNVGRPGSSRGAPRADRAGGRLQRLFYPPAQVHPGRGDRAHLPGALRLF